MNETRGPGHERRAHERYDIPFAIEFELIGEPAAGQQVTGTTINISRGGVLADIGMRVEPESRCRIAFIEAAERVSPSEITGRVVHVGMWKDGRDALGVQFDELLEHLEPNATG
jgi:c-di-GMP-binding flagellar brake protein YcgR